MLPLDVFPMQALPEELMGTNRAGVEIRRNTSPPPVWLIRDYYRGKNESRPIKRSHYVNHTRIA